ncbi:hypothetical protein RQP46_010089 [Phenoliferia psychrophenolica]
MATSRPPYTARIEYKPSVHLEVWLPSASSAGPVSVVAWTHGGGFFDGAAGDCSDANLLPTLERGWAFVSLEYRLAPQVKLDQVLEDVTEAYKFIQHGRLDKALGGGKVDGAKLIVSGSSAGGALCLVAGYKLSPPPLAVLAYYPVANLLHPSYAAPVTFPYQIDYSEVERFLSPSAAIVSHAPAEVNFATMDAQNRTRACFWTIQEGRVAELAIGTTDAKVLSNFVAKTWVGKATPPTVLVHGTVDLMVPIETSIELLEVLKSEGVESLLIKAEGENHGFDLVPGVLADPRKRAWVDAANDFVAKYL